MDYDWDLDERPVRSVGDRRNRARKLAEQLTAEGEQLTPVVSTGRDPARSFWGRAWCRHIEGFQDYASRLAPGRSYLKNGAVIDLKIERGLVTARVAGENLYQVRIHIEPVAPERLEELKRACAGRLEALVDLLRGELSEELIRVFCDPGHGIFPAAEEIRLDCDCPDWADLCKHLAAVLYGVGTRLDQAPELFFTLRGIDPAEFFRAAPVSALAGEGDARNPAPSSAELAELFGIDFE